MIRNLSSAPRESTSRVTYNSATGLTTVTETGSAYVAEWVDFTGQGGQWIAFALDNTEAVGITTVRYNAQVQGGGAPTYNDYFTAGVGRRVMSLQIPQGATGVRFYVWLYRGTPTTRLDPQAGDRVKLTKWYIAIAPTEAEARAQAAIFHDGDSLGWAWEGAPQASTSIGPAAGDFPLPEAELRLPGNGALVEYADLVEELSRRAMARTLVQSSPLSPGQWVTIRPAEAQAGRLQLFFGYATGVGTAYDRARRVADALATGEMYQLRPYVTASAPMPARFVVPAGTPIELTPAPGTAADAWLVTFEWQSVVV